MKLYQQLESLLKMRINSNEEIIPYIKKLSEAGKFDAPKQIAVFAIILDRLGKLEDEKEAASKIAEKIPPIVSEDTSDTTSDTTSSENMVE